MIGWCRKKAEKIWEVLICPYEDKSLAFWMKVVFGFIWSISMVVAKIYKTDNEYFLALACTVILLVLNMIWNRYYQKNWLDILTFSVLCVEVFIVFFRGYIGYFSVLFPLLFSCGVVFILGIRGSLLINLVSLGIIFSAFRYQVPWEVASLYGYNVALRFPYLYICILLIAYLLMYTIQQYWVKKRKRQSILEQRIAEEKKKLQSMSMKIMRSMSKALDAKIPGKEAHCEQVAMYGEQIAKEMGLSEAEQRAVYHAGLLHEIGMIGIADRLIAREDLSEEEYKEFCTYVKQGSDIISKLYGADEVAQAVLYHRENYDGSGYQEGLCAQEIPLLARILAVADYTDRHLRWKEHPKQVKEKLRKQSGRQFDPQVVSVMEKLLI